ncbi:MAG: hypothetical protein ACFCU1_00150 [Sumerlaeia bacterium]
MELPKANDPKSPPIKPDQAAPERSSLPESPSKWALLPEILLFTIIAAFLRFYDLALAGLWKDEVAIFFDALNGTNETVSSAHQFHLSVVGWLLNNVGDSPWVLRSWGAALGTLAVPVLYGVGYLIEGKKLGRMIALVAAFSPFLVFYSRDGNYYGAMTLFASLQLLALGLFLHKQRILAVVILLTTALASHFNHPFASVLSVYAIAMVGLLAAFEVWQNRAALKKLLTPKTIAISILPILCSLAAMIFMIRKFGSALEVLKSKLSFGESLENAEPGLKFFNNLSASMLGSYFRPFGYETLITVISYVPLVFVIAGSFFCTSRLYHALKSKNQLMGEARHQIYPGILCAVFSISFISALIVIFNVSYRTFNIRYFAFLVPGLMILMGFGIHKISELASTKFPKFPLQHLALASIISFYIALLVPMYSPATANYRMLAQRLSEQRTSDTVILLPTTEELSQTRFYFDEEMNNQTDIVQIRAYHDHAAGNWIPYYVYGKADVVIASAWRHWRLTNYWGRVQTLFKTVFEGFSIHGYNQDARLLHWDLYDRALLPNAATTFQLTPQNNEFVFLEGKWKLTGSDNILASLKQKTNAVDSNNIFTADEAGKLQLELTKAERLLAVPVLPNELNYGPYGHVNFINDTRNKEAYLHKGEVLTPEVEGLGNMPEVPVYDMAFDGNFTYLLYQPENEKRHLILKRYCPKNPPAKSHSANPFVYEISVNGVHVGNYISENKPGSWVQSAVDLDLPPGNHSVRIYATRLRENDPFHSWIWGGLQWNNGAAKSPAQKVNPAVFAQSFGPSPMTWGEAGSVEFTEGMVATNADYNRRVSPSEVGPSGLPALEYVFNGEYENPQTAYHTTFARPIPVKEKQLVAYATFLKNDRAINYAVSLTTLFLDANGNSMGIRQGKQQHATFPLTMGWARYVEFLQVPPGCAYVVPGIFVYPPNPKRVAQQGQIYADAFVSVTGQEGPFTPAYLAPELFFDPRNVAAELEPTP